MIVVRWSTWDVQFAIFEVSPAIIDVIRCCIMIRLCHGIILNVSEFKRTANLLICKTNPFAGNCWNNFWVQWTYMYEVISMNLLFYIFISKWVQNINIYILNIDSLFTLHFHYINGTIMLTHIVFTFSCLSPLYWNKELSCLF